MNRLRRQLSLFVPQNQSMSIDNIRERYDPIQSNLIGSHITICREDELININEIISRLKFLNFRNLELKIGKIERFESGKGLWIPIIDDLDLIHQLRRNILNQNPRKIIPHLTLIHPRNATCTDEIFASVTNEEFPDSITFPTLSLIEQYNQGKWIILENFDFQDVFV